MLLAQAMIEETQRWLKLLVIDQNLCPFAHKEHAQNLIHYAYNTKHNDNAYYDSVVTEVERLITNPEISTTLLLWPEVESFESFLSLVGMAEQILVSHKWHHNFQLAHFHPHYCFLDAEPDALENYTNRSPYPMLHILRSDHMARVLNKYPNPEQIPLRNIAHVQAMGVEQLMALLAHCKIKP